MSFDSLNVLPGVLKFALANIEKDEGFKRFCQTATAEEIHDEIDTAPMSIGEKMVYHHYVKINKTRSTIETMK